MCPRIRFTKKKHERNLFLRIKYSFPVFLMWVIFEENRKKEREIVNMSIFDLHNVNDISSPLLDNMLDATLWKDKKQIQFWERRFENEKDILFWLTWMIYTEGKRCAG